MRVLSRGRFMREGVTAAVGCCAGQIGSLRNTKPVGTTYGTRLLFQAKLPLGASFTAVP